MEVLAIDPVDVDAVPVAVLIAVPVVVAVPIAVPVVVPAKLVVSDGFTVRTQSAN